MNQTLFQAVGLLLPPTRSMVGYWVVALAWLLLVAMGYESTGPQAATFWGLKLHGFGGSTSEIIGNSYREMTDHLWTVVTLPFAGFVALKPVLRSFRGDFEHFLRHGRRSRLFVEGARIGAVVVLIVGLSVPFVVGSLIGRWHLGLKWSVVLEELAICATCTLFAVVVVYLLASLRLPAEIAVALGLVVPFFLTGLSSTFEQGAYRRFTQFLPPGLPYTVESVTSPSLRAALVLGVAILLIRLAVNLRTRWLVAVADRSGSFLSAGREGRRPISRKR